MTYIPDDYGALEPAISGKIMELHHDKHHATYVNSYNDAVEKLADAQAKGDIQSQVALQALTNFHGGGHVNHSLFWENLAPRSAGGGEPPSGPLGEAIDEAYGSLKDFRAKFNTTLAGIQGSGWAWLVKDKPTGKICIKTYAVSIISVYPISFRALKYQQLLIYQSLPFRTKTPS
jgi:Fe-Mn family superoxide dismutase